MRSSLLIMPFVLLSFALAHASIFPYPYREEILPNGLKCILVPLDNPGLVAHLTIVRTGSREEIEPGHTGFAHFFEHMMFRGTEKYSADAYNRIHQEMGADDNAFTSDDLTCYYAVVPKQFLARVLETEADRFMNLKYAVPEFQKEAKAVLGEYNKNYASPFFQVEEKFFETAYETHTYKHTTMGFLKDIEDMPNQYDYSLKFFDRFYRPENCVMLIAGDFDPDATMALVKKYYGEWKRGSYKPEYPVEPEQKAEKICHVEYAGKTLPQLWIGYHGPAFDPAQKDVFALTLLGRLAFGETSPLFQELVLKEQKVDLLDGSIDPHRDPYPFFIRTRLKSSADIAAVKDRIDATIEQLKATPPEAAQLADLKSNLKYEFLMGLNSTKSTAMTLINVIQLTGGVSAIDTMYQTLDSITPADIQAAARKYFVKERRTVATLDTGGASKQ